jgi:hypothetical protein
VSLMQRLIMHPAAEIHAAKHQSRDESAVVKMMDAFDSPDHQCPLCSS